MPKQKFEIVLAEPRSEPGPNLDLKVQVLVRRSPGPNLGVQVQVPIEHAEPGPNRTVASLSPPLR